MRMLNLWPLLLPVAALTGWYLGRYRKSTQLPNDIDSLSREYFVGLNYLLNEEPDKAVDVFIKLLEVDNDTIETHLALGSLFRRRGEVDRAIRIHQNLIARPQMSEQQRTEALMALGRDYMSAGVFDRAERIFLEVVKAGSNQTQWSLQCLLDIYQQEKAWQKAIDILQQLANVTGEKKNNIIAHLYCEIAEESIKNQRLDLAYQAIKKAIKTDKNSVRTSLLQGKIASKQGKYYTAIEAYQKVKFQNPDFISEAIPALVHCYDQLDEEQACLAYLYKTLEEYPRISVVSVLANKIKDSHGVESAIEFFAEQLDRSPSVRGLNKLIQWYLDVTQGKIKVKLEMLYNITTRLLINKPVYRCDHCGFSGKNLHWQCPSCKQWNTIKPIHGLEGD